MFMDESDAYENYSFYENYTDYNLLHCGNISIVECKLGPQRDPLSLLIPMAVIYSSILITGVMGNICTCTVISRNRYMHTATNYYLFSLAVSDLLLLVLGLPQEIYQLWYKYPYIFGQAFCILRGYTSEMSTNASILTITAFTVERYVAICHPFRAQAMSHLSRALKIIVCIWVVAALCALPTTFQLGILYEVDFYNRELEQTALCGVINPLPHIFEISTGLFFVLPIVLIIVLYVLIGIRLRKASIGSNKEDANDCHQLSKQKMNSRKAVIKMLIAVVISFFICWSPFHAQRLFAIFWSSPVINSSTLAAFNILTYISGVTYYLSATINPILYQLLSVKFRQAFKDTFSICCNKARHVERRSTEMPVLYANSRHRMGTQSENRDSFATSVSWTGKTLAFD